MARFRVAIGSESRGSGGVPDFPGYGLIPPAISSTFEYAIVDTADAVRATELAGADAFVSTPMVGRITRDSLARSDRLVAIIRAGVGYEDVDDAACTERGVALVIPPEAIRRSTAVAALTLILAVTNRLLDKHRLTLAAPASWAERPNYRGTGLEGRTLGLVGLGNVGAELARLVTPLDLKVIAHDPVADAAAARELGVRLVDIDTLFRTADIVSLHFPLNARTRGLVGARLLGLMKPTAYLINTARGGCVNQRDLTEALRARRIAGAGLDVFDKEPPDADDPLLTLDNVLFSAHCLNWTDHVDELLAEAIARSLLDVLHGREPRTVANRDVLTRPGWRAKLAAVAERCGSKS